MDKKIEIITCSKDLTSEDRALLRRCYNKLPDTPALSVLEHQIDLGVCFGGRLLVKVKEAAEGYENKYCFIVQRMINKDTEESALAAIVGGGYLLTEEGSKGSIRGDIANNVSELHKFLLFAANLEGMDYIILRGRVGWKPFIELLGYEERNRFKSINKRTICEWYFKV